MTTSAPDDALVVTDLVRRFGALRAVDGLSFSVAAGEVLFNRLHSLVMIQVGSFGDALTDVADDISNQILNTFVARDREAERYIFTD